MDEYFVNGDYENAAHEAGRLLSSTTKEQDKIYYILGTSLNKLGKYEAARQNLQLLLKMYPKSVYAPLAQLGFADSYYLNADYQNASESYEEYIAKYPKSESAAQAYFKLAKCAQKDGKWQTARNYYQKVRNEYPLSFEAQLAAQALSEEVLYFTVQVGSFNKKANALKLCDELIRKGYDASILKAESEDRDFYKVRVGRLNSREEAEELAKRLQSEGLPTNILP
ncbi:MAG: SPOR domain-containing protein [Candidatus Omnitrophota bacterium]